MAICDGCGDEFEPRRSYHRYCDRCYRLRQGWVSPRERFYFARHPDVALLMMAVGAVIVLLIRVCVGP